MSILNLTETELKSNLQQKLNSLNREQLLLAHQFVARIIAEDLIESVTQDWESGKVNGAAIQRAIAARRTAQRLRQKDGGQKNVCCLLVVVASSA